MTENEVKLSQLLDKMDSLLIRHDSFSREISALSVEIHRLKSVLKEEPLVKKQDTEVPESVNVVINEAIKEPIPPIFHAYNERISNEKPRYFDPKPVEVPKEQSNLEKFIGENLINKIGIIITVIGVAIGVKYSIDHELISPLTRIILGYLMGLGLLAIGLKLKANYENYSAVLVSGAIAIMYFITFSAYSFYDLIPQVPAFILMVIFTAFGVMAALRFNKQVIAHIGLVGAYAVPFLLSDNSGNVTILFSYIALINIGILIIAVKKYWKPIYYSSFLVTWLIFFSWFNSKYEVSEHFGLVLTFITVFFATFYIIFLAYKLIKKEKFDIDDIFLLLANSFLFYAIGYSVLKDHETGKQLLGLFTLCNALIHFGVSAVIYQQKLADRNLFYLVAGLVLTFFTIAIPVQLDGNWVTLLWTCEAALLFWIGRTKNVFFYEKLSYALMILAFFSLIHDWSTVYDVYNPDQPDTRIVPLLNINFLTSILFVASFGFINVLNRNTKYPSPLISQQGILRLVSILIPAILLIVLFGSFRIEISTYWNQLFVDSKTLVKGQNAIYFDVYQDTDLLKFKAIWMINYALLFVSLLSFFNIKKLKNSDLGIVNLLFSTLVLLVFLIQGLYFLGILRESYLNQTLSEHYVRSSFSIGIRYISFGLVGLVLFSIYNSIRQDFMKTISLNFSEAFDIMLYTTLIWIASSELINWMDIIKFTQSYKLGLSILWGVSALILIALGIWKKKKHLRIGAIALFGVTLIKLFFYDISHLDTIAKTIVFVALGILLLIISFLYNKYKHLISEEVES